MQRSRVMHVYGRYRQERTKRLDTLLHTYAIGIEACHNGNIPLALDSVRVLRGALDYSASPELAFNLDGLYHACEGALKEGSFEIAEKILQIICSAFQALSEA